MKQKYLSLTRRVIAAFLAFIICMITVPKLDFSAIKADAAYTVVVKKGYHAFSYSYTIKRTDVNAKLSSNAPAGTTFTTQKGKSSTTYTVNVFANNTNKERFFSLYIQKNGTTVKELQFTQAAAILKIQIDGEDYYNGYNTNFYAYENLPIKIKITTNDSIKLSLNYCANNRFSNLSSQTIGSYKENGSTSTYTIKVSFPVKNYTDKQNCEDWKFSGFSSNIRISFTQKTIHRYSNDKNTDISGVMNRTKYAKGTYMYKLLSNKWEGFLLTPKEKKADMKKDGIKVVFRNENEADAYLYYSDQTDYDTAYEITTPRDWHRFAIIKINSNTQMTWYHANEYGYCKDPVSGKYYSTVFKEYISYMG